MTTLKRMSFKIGALALTAMPLVAFGQRQPQGLTGGPQSGSDLLNLIETITNWVAAIFFMLAVIFIIIAAFGYLQAGGDEEKVKSSRQKLIYAVVAIVVAALAYFIPRIIINILGIGVNLPS